MSRKLPETQEMTKEETLELMVQLEDEWAEERERRNRLGLNVWEKYQLHPADPQIQKKWENEKKRRQSCQKKELRQVFNNCGFFRAMTKRQKCNLIETVLLLLHPTDDVGAALVFEELEHTDISSNEILSLVDMQQLGEVLAAA